jgi:putative tryptophan/tyrosine transport system substrate-binding protein
VRSLESDPMKRREFITLLGSAAAAWPPAADAQAPAMPVIGFLNNASPGPAEPLVAAFHRALVKAGYVEGRNVTVEYRWAEGQYDRLRPLADDLVRRKVAVIVATGGTVTAQAAKAATFTIPVLFIVGFDPVQEGLTSSINRPGGNATGISVYTVDSEGSDWDYCVSCCQASARSPCWSIRTASRPRSRGQTWKKPGAPPDCNWLSSRPAPRATLRRRSAAQSIMGPARSSSLPMRSSRAGVVKSSRWPHSTRYWKATHGRKYAYAGGLMSYGPSLTWAYEEVGVYVGRILKGAKPEDLPVQLPTRFEMVINLKTAKTLGLTVPLTLQASANEVIE